MLKRLLTLLMLISITNITFIHNARAEDSMTMTRAEADKIIDSAKLKAVKHIKDFPKEWFDAMHLDGMSDVHGPFSAGCTGPEPHRRMIAGAISDDYAVIHSESGGFAYFKSVGVYHRANGEIKEVYRQYGGHGELDDIEKKLAAK